jgi:hypothetical protein
MAAHKPPFLKDNSASASSAGPKDPFADRPQKDGSAADYTASSDENFPDRPQKMGGSKGNPQSIPSGGTSPLPAAPAPKLPFKLGK